MEKSINGRIWGWYFDELQGELQGEVEFGAYSRIRVDVPECTPLKWFFSQEKATSHDFRMGTVTRILL